jgi:hypothetical protein
MNYNYILNVTRFWWESPKERDHWEDHLSGVFITRKKYFLFLTYWPLSKSRLSRESEFDAASSRWISSSSSSNSSISWELKLQDRGWETGARLLEVDISTRTPVDVATVFQLSRAAKVGCGRRRTNHAVRFPRTGGSAATTALDAITLPVFPNS